MVFLAPPRASRLPDFLPTFRPAGAPGFRKLADFSADLGGVSTANLENLKSSLVLAEITLFFRGESLEVACKCCCRGCRCGARRCNIIFIIVSNVFERCRPPALSRPHGFCRVWPGMGRARRCSDPLSRVSGFASCPAADPGRIRAGAMGFFLAESQRRPVTTAVSCSDRSRALILPVAVSS
jgi:hypothetical protein